MSKTSITVVFIVTFVVGLLGALGFSRGVDFFISNSQPEVVILDPSLKFYRTDDDLGGPPPELDETEADVLPDENGDDDSHKRYFLRDGGKFPLTYARSLIVADIETGDVIATKKPYQAFPIASISKLMTAIVAEETYNANDIVTISKNAVATYGEQGGLRVGEEYTVQTLLYPLLLESSNDAAEALAEHGGRIGFIADMNAKAQSLSLVHTKFDDPSGLSYGNTSAAYDLFLLSQYINNFRSYIFDITKEKRHSENGKTWYSNSRFKNDEEHIGSKNGYTDEALKTQVVLFELPLGEDGELRIIAIILLGSGDTESDARNIKRFLEKYVYYE